MVSAHVYVAVIVGVVVVVTFVGCVVDDVVLLLFFDCVIVDMTGTSVVVVCRVNAVVTDCVRIVVNIVAAGGDVVNVTPCTHANHITWSYCCRQCPLRRCCRYRLRCCSCCCCCVYLCSYCRCWMMLFRSMLVVLSPIP